MVEQNKSNEGEDLFDRRPLLNLISELHRRQIGDQSIPKPSIFSGQQNNLSNSMLPPKLLTPFRPIIVHKKYQVMISCCFFVWLIINGNHLFSFKGTDWSF